MKWSFVFAFRCTSCFFAFHQKFVMVIHTAFTHQSYRCAHVQNSSHHIWSEQFSKTAPRALPFSIFCIVYFICTAVGASESFACIRRAKLLKRMHRISSKLCICECSTRLLQLPRECSSKENTHSHIGCKIPGNAYWSATSMHVSECMKEKTLKDLKWQKTISQLLRFIRCSDNEYTRRVRCFAIYLQIHTYMCIYCLVFTKAFYWTFLRKIHNIFIFSRNRASDTFRHSERTNGRWTYSVYARTIALFSLLLCRLTIFFLFFVE